MSNLPSRSHTRQSGAALLVFMLILIMGSSYMLVKSLNDNLRRQTDIQNNADVLRAAKDTLLSYSATYPDNVNPLEGPGYLPCPDLNNDGSASGNCSFAGGTTVGRLPHRTLGLEALRDSSGEKLWYAVSDSFKYGAQKIVPMNSDEPEGTLAVDDVDDVVAVIIAPGPPLSGQGGRDDPGGVNDPANYLDGINSSGDENYTRSGDGEFNDQLIYITRRELMSLVEKRVLGEVAQKLTAYRQADWNTNGAFPWLSEFDSPEISTFKSRVDVRRGHIPYHWSEDLPGESNRNPFQSAASWIWHTDPGTATGYFTGTVTADCLRNVDCDDGLYPPITSVDTTATSCIWTNKQTVNCEPSDWITTTTVSCNMGCPLNGTCTRQYKVEFPGYSVDDDVIINTPDADTVRTRDVHLTGTLPAQNRAVEILDRYTGAHPSTLCLTSTTATIGSGYINFLSTTTGTIGTSRIQYDLDADADEAELPSWFFENEWHHFVYVAYPDAESLPGSTTACIEGQDCIVLNDHETRHENVRAIALHAGPADDPARGIQQVRPGDELSQYFEYDNADPATEEFRTNRWNPPNFTEINDQVRVVEWQ